MNRTTGSMDGLLSSPRVFFKKPIVCTLFLAGIAIVVYSLDWKLGDVVGEVPRRSSYNVLLSEEPSASFRDNLRPDLHYITTSYAAGFNNQVIGLFNLLAVAVALRKGITPTDIVPILQPFSPHLDHLKADFATPFRVSQLFDLDRLSDSLEVGLVEWHQLKTINPCCGDKSLAKPGDFEDVTGERKRDKLSCWSSMMTKSQQPHHLGQDLEHFDIDLSFTPLPDMAVLPVSNGPRWMAIPLLVALFSPLRHKSPVLNAFLNLDTGMADQQVTNWPNNNLTANQVFGPSIPGWTEPEGRRPGEVLCFDNLFYASHTGLGLTSEPIDITTWALVGVHARWSRQVEDVAWQTIRTILQLQDGNANAQVDPFVTVHIRRGDYVPDCSAGELCGLSVAQYVPLVQGISRQVGEKYGISRVKVLVTTDEIDPGYLAEIENQGWHLMDHDKLRTSEKFGPWYPTILDNVILSLGSGFVGTSASSMSWLAANRVKQWNDGFVDRLAISSGNRD